METKQYARLQRRLRKSKNRAAHREKTWEDFVNKSRWKWSKKAQDILWAHHMWKAYKNAGPPTNVFDQALRSEAKQSTPEMLNWARRVAGARHKGRLRMCKSISGYIRDTMQRPGFARQILISQP